jgi:hypothetical protein
LFHKSQKSFTMNGWPVPVPVKRIVMGAVFPLFATFTLPVLEPDAVGEKVTLTAQLPFGPNGDPGDSASPVGASAKAGEVEGRDDTLAVWGVDFDGCVCGSRIGRVVFLPDNKTR